MACAPVLVGFWDGLWLQKAEAAEAAEAAAAGWLQLAGCFGICGRGSRHTVLILIYCGHAARRAPHMHCAQGLRQDKQIWFMSFLLHTYH